jgi:hypothetical protein
MAVGATRPDVKSGNAMRAVRGIEITKRTAGPAALPLCALSDRRCRLSGELALLLICP